MKFLTNLYNIIHFTCKPIKAEIYNIHIILDRYDDRLYFKPDLKIDFKWTSKMKIKYNEI